MLPTLGTCMGRQEFASFQSAVRRIALQSSSAKKKLADELRGQKVVEAFVPIASE